MAVTFVSTNTPVRQAGGAFSSAFTVSATSAAHIALAHVAWDGATGLSISSITLGGVAMTAVGTAVQSTADGGGNFGYVQSYYLINPPSGSQTLAITVTSANEIYANVVLAVGDSAPVITGYTTAAPSAVSSGGVTVSSAADQLTMSAATCAGGASFTGTNQTSDGISAVGSNTFGSDHCTTPGSSITHTWTADGNGEFAVLGFSLRDAIIEQEGFRARNDDGPETAATWKAPQDVNFFSPLSANLRLRVILDTPDDPATKAFRLDYKKSTDSVYVPVPTSSAPFPVIEATQESSVNTAGTSHAVTLPAGIVATDLVLIIMDIGSTSATLNALTDWAEDLDESAANGLKILRYTGAGVPSNPTFTSSASTRSASIAYRISGADKTTAPTIGSTSSGSSATPDPPSVSPPGGVTKSFLIITFYGAAGEEADDDTWSDTPPTNYTPSPPLQKACGTAGTNLGGMIAAASRQLSTGSAVNPGTFAKDVSAAWRAQTILIHPAIPPIFVSASANIAAGGEDTTPQLIPPAGKTTSEHTTGRMWDDENGVDPIDIGSNRYTEPEWCLQAQAPAVNGDIYQFRVTAGGTVLGYSVTPEWTIGSPPPVARRLMVNQAVQRAATW